MAFFPCDRGHANPRGRNHTIYSAYGSGGSDFSRFRLRLCGAHAADVYEHLAQFEVDPESGTLRGAGADLTCLACLEPISEVGWQVFVTCYPTNNERKDYWSQLHTNCRFPAYLINPSDNGNLARPRAHDPLPGA